MSLLAILTGLYRLNTLLPHGRAHSIAHHHYTMVFESSSLLQHLLHFNCWLKWWLFTNCCWSPEKTVFILFMNTHDRLLLPPSLSDFQRSCQSFLQPWFGTNTYIPHCMERWVYFAIFFVTLPQISSLKTGPLRSTFTSLFLKGLSILLFLTPQAGIFIMFASTCDFSGMTSPCYFCFVN